MKKKLLFINGHMNTGGVEKSLLDVLCHLDYERYEVDLLLLEEIGDYGPRIPAQVNVMLHSLVNTYGSLGSCILRCIRQGDWDSLKLRLIFLAQKFLGVRAISMARRILTGGKRYDCVIGYRPGICTQLAAYAVDADRRISWWHHGQINVGPGYQEDVRTCDAVVVVSEACRRMLAEKFPTLTEKMTVVPNILDAEAIRAAAEPDPYPAHGLCSLVSVGRLSPEKHFDNIILAARQLKDRGFDFRWHLVGDGPQRAEMEEMAAKLNVADCCVFEGNQVNPYPYMKHADLFVHPSYVESFGIVAAEALTLGVPCVVTESEGVLSFLRDGENALLTRQDPDDLAEKVASVLSDPDLCARLRAGSRCPEGFLPDTVMQKIEHLLEK